MRHMNWPWLEESLRPKSFLEAAMRLVSTRLLLQLKNLKTFQGGQAFMIKLRKPRDRSASAMLIEPPYTLRLPDSDDPEDGAPFRWRYLKY